MLDTVELAYEQHGPPGGTPIVFLGSLGSDRSMWQPQIDGLSDAHGVITVDLRGHGQSPVPVRTYTVATIADDVAALLARLEIARAHVVGLSLGGATAQQLTIARPELVASVTLLCTSARFGDPEPWVDRAQSVRVNGTASLAAAVVDRWFTDTFARRNPGLIERMRTMIAETPDEGYAASCEALAAFDSRAALPQITAPTLVIGGAEDPATPPEHQQFLADRIPDSRLLIIDHAAHLAPYEQRSVINDAIAEHVAGR